MDQMGSFLVELLGTAAGVAAGAAGTAAGGPLVGAVLGTAATEVTSSLIGKFLHVQDAQLRSFEDLNRDLSGGLAQVEAGLFRVEGQVQQLQASLSIQLDEPWQTAHLYLEHAAESQLRKATRDDYLVRARDKLFEAYSVAEDDVRRALVAQRLAAIAMMLNDRPSARKWLVGTYPIVAGFVISAAAEVEQLFVVEWDLETIVAIVAKVNDLEQPPEPSASPFNAQTKRTSRLAALTSVQGWDSGKLDWNRLLREGSARNFWVCYIKATVGDREAVRKARLFSDETLEKLVQVQAIRRLHWMVEDLRHLRVASLQLGGDASVVPEYFLVVDLLPIRKPEVRLDIAAN